MLFKIHGTWPDGTEDSIIIEGDSVAEVREKADEETSKRNWTNLWSEQLS